MLPRNASPFAAQKPDDVAVILFTSGTTATPKAVPLTHANLLSNINAILAAGLAGAKDRALLPLPLHHAYPLTVGMMSGLACGTTIVLPAGVSGPEMIAALQRGGATILMGVPRLYSALLAGIRQRIAAQPRLSRRVFALLLALALRLRRKFGKSPRFFFRPLHRQLAPSLRLLVSGGAKLDEDVEQTLGALGWDVMTGYGLTETSPILAFNAPGAARAGSAGRALSGVELRIVNADAEGVGEIEAKGASVFAGYRGDDEATSHAFTADHWFRTGDFGRIDKDGYLFIVARVSETIVLADGKKLFPEAVEAVYADHPLIAEVALFSLKGALVALVVPNLDTVRAQGAVRLREAIRDALAERARQLPSHARLTGFALARDKLPRTQLGKIRRHLVPALYDEAMAAPPALKPAELSPEDKALLDDETAAKLWQWLGARFPGHALGLDMSPEMDLGIDSLGWVDVTLALEHEIGVRLTEQEIGRIVTLRDLLREAVAARGRPAPAHAREAGGGAAGARPRVVSLARHARGADPASSCGGCSSSPPRARKICRRTAPFSSAPTTRAISIRSWWRRHCRRAGTGAPGGRAGPASCWQRRRAASSARSCSSCRSTSIAAAAPASISPPRRSSAARRSCGFPKAHCRATASCNASRPASACWSSAIASPSCRWRSTAATRRGPIATVFPAAFAAFTRSACASARRSSRRR